MLDESIHYSNLPHTERISVPREQICFTPDKRKLSVACHSFMLNVSFLVGRTTCEIPFARRAVQSADSLQQHFSFVGSCANISHVLLLLFVKPHQLATTEQGRANRFLTRPACGTLETKLLRHCTSSVALDYLQMQGSRCSLVFLPDKLSRTRIVTRQRWNHQASTNRP
jgi:hypothetical protein